MAVLLTAYLAIVPLYARRQRRVAADGREIARMTNRDWASPPSVDVIVTCYNERPELLGRCLDSLREQDYRGRIKVWVVDDGSQNRAELLPVLAKAVRLGWRVTLSEQNYGKRIAQALALGEGKGKIVVTVDSDTVVAPDGIRRIVAPFRHRRVGAVTSSLRALNAEASWLAEAIDTRYGLLCERERAAQGFYGSVLCCAGPFSAFRRTAVQQVLQPYLSRRRTGDDLELTNLVLATGWRSEYQPEAKAWTQVPATLKEFALQQRRWNGSFYRELPRMLRIVARRDPYLRLDLAVRALLPVLLAGGLLAVVVDAVSAPERLGFDAAALALMALASAGLGPSWRQRSSRRFALCYGLVFLLVLLPVRGWAALTVLWDRWGTRGPVRSALEGAEQTQGIALADHVPLRPVEVNGVLKFARRFSQAAVEA
jgi:N-acetylglucosaminyltransferase